MSILTKVLIGLVIVAVFPVLYLAASVLNIQNEWHRKIKDFQAAIDKHEKQYELLLHGDFDAQTHPLVPGKPIVGNPGVMQWQTARDNIMRGAGRVWYGRPQAASISAETGTLKLELFSDEVNLDMNGRSPLNDHGLVDKAFLYVFQMSHTGDLVPGTDKYVGEFVVSGLPPGTNENMIPIKPALPLTAAEWDALKASAATAQWVVYDKMPTDSRDVFVGLTEDEIRRLVPPEVADEYINDDQTPTKAVTDNPALAEYVVTDPASKKSRFLRPLRDYQTIFQAAAKRLNEMADRVQILNREKAFADQALVNLQMKTIPALDARKARLEKERALVDSELKVVQALSEKLTASIEQAKQDVVRTVLENKRLLGEAAAGGKTTSVPAPMQPLATVQ
jgi:hypothetical protein